MLRGMNRLTRILNRSEDIPKENDHDQKEEVQREKMARNRVCKNEIDQSQKKESSNIGKIAKIDLRCLNGVESRILWAKK